MVVKPVRRVSARGRMRSVLDTTRLRNDPAVSPVYILAASPDETKE